MNTTPDDHTPDAHDAPPGGMNLLRVMVIFTMMGCGGALLARRFEPDALQVSRAIHDLRLAAAKVEEQALAVRPERVAQAATAGVQVRPTPEGGHRVRIESRGADGHVAATVLQGGRVASSQRVSTPAELPRLTEEARQRALATDPARRRVVEGHTVLIGDVDGLVVLSPGATVVLRDVVLRGSLVSSVALDGIEGDAIDAPEIVVEGSLRIDPSPELRGVAVLAPTSRLTTAGLSSSVQIHGDVVVRALDLAGAGSLFGHLATVSEPLLSPRIMDMTGGRGQVPWSESIAVEGGEPRYVAFAADRPEWSDVNAMTGFRFPESNR